MSRDVLIVRQVCLKAAVEFVVGCFGREGEPGDVVRCAQEFEGWVLRDVDKEVSLLGRLSGRLDGGGG